MALIEVSRDEFRTISVDPKGPLVKLVRSDVPYQTLDMLEKSVLDMARTLDVIGREGRVLLSDLRAAQGRNDPTFEDRMMKLRPRLYEGFVRVGILVRSSVGALQVKRMMQEDKIPRMVSTDEAMLVEYLLRG
jgi:hypothetical protein